jgi:exopolyphosphatase/guanosine-5'-triphosphate,3'-diphosphate pyrophosphatase
VRIAALDLGSNSFHLIVVEVNFDGTFSPIVREKEMLRLGDLVARTGEIGEEAMESAIEVLSRFKTIATAHRVDEIIAIGTAAIREASDGAEFVKRAERSTGMVIKVVDGLVEAQTIFSAVRASVLIDPSPALAIDLGGGSLELMVGDQSGLAFATSTRLGVGRLTAEYLDDDPPSSAQLKRLNAHIAEELEPVIDEIAELKPRMLIGSSGTFACLARMAAALRDGLIPESLNQLSVYADDLRAVSRRIFDLNTAERAKLPGCDPKRSELLPAGISVLTYIMSEMDLDELVMSEWALREGIVISAISAHDRADLDDDPRAIRRSSVLSLCRRSNWRQPHARQVATMAQELFDQTVELHHLEPVDKELLEYAALTHDIGEHISRTDHDRHSAYLIENGGLRGFSPDEIRMLSVMSRFHYRGTPRLSNSAYALLGVPERDRVMALTAILRIADALDAAHGAGVRRLVVDREGRSWTISCATRGDGELEGWSFQRKKELFEKVFDVELHLKTTKTQRSEFDVGFANTIGLS